MTQGNEMTHTPGPWEWKDDDLAEYGHYRLHPGILLSQESDGTPWGDEIDRANARLIAAAPELLEALIKIGYAPEEGPVGPDLRGCIEIARAAIEKATGKR